MPMLAHREPPPSAQDAEIARFTSQKLTKYATTHKPLSLHINDPAQPETIELPKGAVKLLLDVLEAMAAGHGVTIIPENAELTTVQASNILNVSRPYLIKLLNEKAIPHRKVGKHRRILIEDVMNYKMSIDAKREKVLDQLIAEAQEYYMAYNL